MTYLIPPKYFSYPNNDNFVFDRHPYVFQLSQVFLCSKIGVHNLILHPPAGRVA